MSSLEIGDGSPTLLDAVAPDGSWTTLCQAREDSDHDGQIAVEVGPHGQLSGDRLDTYFVHGSGLGEKIDAFVAGDPSGRFVALIQDGKLLLRDLVTSTVLDLSARGADIRDDQGSFRSHRAGSFDPSGKRFLYLSGDDAHPSVRLLELENGKESTIEPGTGLLWRADFDATGEQILLQVVDRDTNKNHTLEWPYPARSEGARGCPGPIPEYDVWEYPGDQPSTRVATLDGVVRDAPGFVLSLGDGWLMRDTDNALYWERPNQPRVLWASAKCHGRVFHADGARKLALIACLDAKGGPKMQLSAEGSHSSLDLSVSHFESEVTLPDLPRLVPLYAKENPVIVDLDTHGVAPLNKGDWVVASYGERALIRRDRSLLLWQASELRPLPGKVDALAQTLMTGSMVFVSPVVMDLASGRVLGEAHTHALALSLGGAVLVPHEYPPAPTRLPRGPLHWELPVAPDP